ncbi:MAG: hypothetical protein JW880_02750 [Candidatus Thermoplasmatota archaeon]|nr:hypothetical protein [Candidatus Thermoplasmatota archaeon]
MWMPVRSRENELVDLVLLALSRRAKAMDLRPAGWSTRISKTTFFVAKELDLPITRSWFKFGAHVWADNATETRLCQFMGLTEPDPSINMTIDYAKSEGKSVFRQIQEVIDKHEFILTSSTSKILDWLYFNEAPKEYRGIYRSHKKVMDRIDKILDSIWQVDASCQYANAAEEITHFHEEMLYFQDRQDMVDLVIDSTSLLESLLIHYESNLDNYDPLKKLAKFLDSFYRGFYLADVWKFPASAITLETVVGENADSVRIGLGGYLNRVEAYRNELDDWTEKAYTEGCYPSKLEIEDIQKRLSSRLSSDTSSLKRLYYEGLLTD